MKRWIAYHMPSFDVSVRWPSAKRRLSSPPNLGGGLTSARCELDTPQCLAACSWQVRSKILRGEVFVPPRTKAELSLPGQPASKFLPGRQIEKIMNIRKAFVMSVNAGAEQEYEKRHNPIWPELERLLNEWCRCE